MQILLIFLAQKALKHAEKDRKPFQFSGNKIISYLLE